MKSISRLKTKWANEIKDAFDDYCNKPALDNEAYGNMFEITYDFDEDNIDLQTMRMVNYKIIGPTNDWYNSKYRKVTIRTLSLHLF